VLHAVLVSIVIEHPTRSNGHTMNDASSTKSVSQEGQKCASLSAGIGEGLEVAGSEGRNGQKGSYEGHLKAQSVEASAHETDT
jgi:hypothetical protein